MKRWKVRIHVCTFGHWHRERKKERQLICTKQNNVCVATQSTQYSPTSPCSSLSHRNGMDLHKTQSKWTTCVTLSTNEGSGQSGRTVLITISLTLQHISLSPTYSRSFQNWKITENVLNWKFFPSKMSSKSCIEDRGWGLRMRKSSYSRPKMSSILKKVLNCWL